MKTKEALEEIGKAYFLDDNIFIVKGQKEYRILEQALTELEELKATVKELLDIPITVSTFSGTSLLIKTMNKLNKLVGDKDE